MFATQYDDEFEADLMGVVVLLILVEVGIASTGEVDTERRRTRSVTNSAAAEKVNMMMRLLLLTLR